MTDAVMRGEKIADAWSEHGEKLRFLLVGLWNSLFAYLLFALLLGISQPLLQPAEAPATAVRWLSNHYYLVVQWAAWILGVPQSTITFKYLVFHSKGNLAGELARSYLVYAPLQLWSFGILWFFSGLLGLHPLLGQFIAALTNAVLSYFGHRHFTFGRALDG